MRELIKTTTTDQDEQAGLTLSDTGAGAVKPGDEGFDPSSIAPLLGGEAPARSEISRLLVELRPREVRLAVARTLTDTIDEACQLVGVAYSTAQHWNRAGMDELVSLLEAQPVDVARARQALALNEALSVKLQGLRSDSEKVRQDTATQLIEWVLGKAPAKVEHGGRVVVEGYHQALVKVWGGEARGQEDS